MLAARTLSIDIETYSSVDLKNCGIYKYAASKDFDILIISYKFEDSDELVTIDVDKARKGDAEHASNLKWFAGTLMNRGVIKKAYNAQFERVCFEYFFKRSYDPIEWRCTLVQGARGGMPIGLNQIAAIMRVPVQKDAKGAALIRLFSIPNKDGNRVCPTTDELKNEFAEYIDYNRTDVLAEQSVNDALGYVHVPNFENKLYALDQIINGRGVKVDIDFVKKVIEILAIVDKKNLKKSIVLSGVINPKSSKQVLEYLQSELGEKIESTNKTVLNELLERDYLPDDVREFIHAKLSLSKTSTAKYDKMLLAADNTDRRARGLFQYYGATRTGRWAGRLIQLQNLPRISIKGDLAKARHLIAKLSPQDAIDAIEMIHGNVNYFCSEMIRPAFIPETGNKFVIADFSSIENRVLAWFAGETWKIEAFNKGRDVYIETAIKMFHLDPSKNYKDTPERQKGKTCELGLGYQGGYRALMRTAAYTTLIKELKDNPAKRDQILEHYDSVGDYIQQELEDLVSGWRSINPKIVSFWYDVQRAAISAVKGIPVLMLGLRFYMKNKHLIIRLLSGRELVYSNAKIEPGRYGDAITFYGVDGQTKKWVKRDTYGGMLTENIIQATARDALAWTMLRCENEGIKIVMHVHDEIVTECKEKYANAVLGRVLGIMSKPIKWAPGLMLKGEGKISNFYSK